MDNKSIDFSFECIEAFKRLPSKQRALLGENQKDVLPYCSPTEEMKNAVKELLSGNDKTITLKIGD